LLKFGASLNADTRRSFFRASISEPMAAIWIPQRRFSYDSPAA
jgi:hypothetical protein